MIPWRLRFLTVTVLTLTAMTVIASDADARAGRGGSFGSRGARTYSAPPPTRTAPTTATPMQRTTTQPSTAATGQAGAGRTATAASPGGFLSRPGLLGGLAAGFIGAGLFGMLFGHGLGGGLGSLASFLGLVLQIGLIGLVAWLVWGWWQRRNQQPAFAGAPNRSSYSFERTDNAPQGGVSMAGGAPMGVPMMAAGQDDVTIAPADYDTFERLLTEVQLAYGKEDLDTLRRLVTPEMLGYFADDLADNASRGVVNKVADVKLLSGDLAEAWTEGHVEYATVAMHFSLLDWSVDRANGQVVDGDASQPGEATELWTFRRASGGQWMLSAVQQA